MRYPLCAIIVWFGIFLTLTGCKPEADPRAMTSLSEDERRQKFEDDLKLIRRYDKGLQRTLEYAKGRPDLFPRSESVELTPGQKKELREIWATVIDYMRALDAIKEYWKKFHEYGALKERRAHSEAFVAGYSAWLVQYRHGLDFVDLTVPSKVMEKLLDESAPENDIPAGSFGALKWNVIHVKAVTRLMGSHQYYKTVEPALRDADCHKKKWCNWAIDTVDGYHGGAKEQLKERAAIQFSYNAFDIARDMSFDAWFPVQRSVAEWMGDTKVRRLHQNLISAEQLEEMRQVMQPGDIIVARHNWYLSNVGLPGFWPHAELYLGSPEELAAYFDDAEVKPELQKQFGTADFTQHLKESSPEAWAAYTTAEAEPHRIIEAISEGVVFSTLSHGAGADYVGVMRPRRDKLAKALAISQAFGLHGRAYDFNFDFTTDETLVCTELVYKSWKNDVPAHALDLETAKVMGRITLPANDLVRQFDERCDADDAPLEFVYFLDGAEKERTAVVRGAEEFRKSWQRPKWDTMQE